VERAKEISAYISEMMAYILELMIDRVDDDIVEARQQSF
jgi:hypothetical protein